MIEIVIFFLGGAVASFTQLLADRIPREETILGRSHCERCKKTLRPIDLIPVISFLLLRGRCPFCHTRIPVSHLIYEFSIGLLFIFLYLLFAIVNFSQLLFVYLVLTISLPIILIDIKKHVILDEFILLLIGAGILLNWGHLPQLIGSAVLTTFIMWVPYYLTGGSGMGMGDVKLAFGIGAILPLAYALSALYIAFLTGGIISVILIILKKRTLKSAIAFGPFMIVGLILVLIYYLKT